MRAKRRTVVKCSHVKLARRLLLVSAELQRNRQQPIHTHDLVTQHSVSFPSHLFALPTSQTRNTKPFNVWLAGISFHSKIGLERSNNGVEKLFDQAVNLAAFFDRMPTVRSRPVAHATFAVLKSINNLRCLGCCIARGFNPDPACCGFWPGFGPIMSPVCPCC